MHTCVLSETLRTPNVSHMLKVVMAGKKRIKVECESDISDIKECAGAVMHSVATQLLPVRPSKKDLSV